MSRITIPAREAAPAASQPLLDAVEQSLGSIPNLFRLIALSPVALEAYLGQNGLLAKTLSVKTRERIALAVAQVNGCDYCLSAHTYLGLNLAGLDDEEIALNRNGHSNDPKADAAVSFAAKVARERGRVDNADVAALRAAGYDDSKIVEIVALVAESSFTNFLNNVVQTEVDFPAVSAADLAEVCDRAGNIIIEIVAVAPAQPRVKVSVRLSPPKTTSCVGRIERLRSDENH